MKKIISYVLFLLLIVGCSKTEVSDTGNPLQNETSQTEISDNVAKVFGTTFNANHDWSSTSSTQVTATFTQNVKKIQVMAYIFNPVDSTNTLTVLNSYEPNGDTQKTFTVDVPKTSKDLFVSFITNNDIVLKKVENGRADYSSASTRSAARRALSFDYQLPTAELKLTEEIVPYEASRGWFPDERFYAMADYESQKMAVDNYSEETKTAINAMVFSYFPDGRQYNNLDKVKATGMFNEKIYPFTTGEEPIIIAPIYKCDGATRWGNEVYNSQLYYYYFKDEDLGSDPVTYIRNLPKYQAIPFNQHFGVNEDNNMERRNAYALIYWGDGVPNENTRGSYTFPKGYRVGFIVRATTTAENGKKQGELWGDGRFNNEINSYGPCNFRSSKLETDGPRAAWLSINGRLLMCWESGTDTDFNDIILDVEGGIEGITVIPETESQVYTYCFEDRDLGDYDMNDIVIKAVRKNSKTVEYSIVACGAYDKLHVKGINAGVITDDAEVHNLFKANTSTFINTTANSDYTPITVTKTVSESFSLLDETTQPYIYNETTGKEIHMSKLGEDPHGIMIPNDFRWPLEKTCVKDAYSEFNSWGENPVTSTDWYKKPNTDKVY